jgi:hypothetical protein
VLRIGTKSSGSDFLRRVRIVDYVNLYKFFIQKIIFDRNALKHIHELKFNIHVLYISIFLIQNKKKVKNNLASIRFGSNRIRSTSKNLSSRAHTGETTYHLPESLIQYSFVYTWFALISAWLKYNRMKNKNYPDHALTNGFHFFKG